MAAASSACLLLLVVSVLSLLLSCFLSQLGRGGIESLFHETFKLKEKLVGAYALGSSAKQPSLQRFVQSLVAITLTSHALQAQLQRLILLLELGHATHEAAMVSMLTHA